MRLPGCHPAWLWAAALLATTLPPDAAAQAHASLFGRVVDVRTRLPIAGARITVTGLKDTLTADAAGRFAAATLSTGAHVLEVRAIGYDVTRWTLELQAGRLDIAVELESRLPLMDTILVAGRPDDPFNWRSAAAFELRRQRGNGQFVTPQYLEQSAARSLAEVLRTVPGVWVVCRGGGAFGHCEVRLAAGPRGPCLPRYLLDGYPATNSTGSDFPLVRIRGIEVYSSSEAPPEFQAFNNQCGVIAMWTRMER